MLKQFYISPDHQRKALVQNHSLLLKEQAGMVNSMALFVLKNNPAFQFYERLGFDVVRETTPRW